MPTIRLPSGATINYRLGGKTGAETVVFINALACDLHSWRAVEPAFADAYGTLCFDCRGQGDSDPLTEPHGPHQHASDVLELIEALSLPSVHLVGSSSGGLIGLIAAGESSLAGRPQVVSASAICSFIAADAILKRVFASWRAALAAGPALAFDVAAPWLWGRQTFSRDDPLLAGFRSAVTASEPRSLTALTGGLAAFTDAKKSLRAFDGPVLAAAGQDDRLTPLRYSHEIVEWAKHGVLVTLENAGHLAAVERPDIVARVVRGFIDRRDQFMQPLDRDRGGGAAGG